MSKPRNQGFVGAGCDARAERFGGAWMTAQVITPPTASSSGTATRSARPTARGPSATTAVDTSPRPTTQYGMADSPPSRRAPTDAAITLFTPIQAKLVTYSSAATSPAPRTPSAARAAITDGTPSLGPSTASAATSSDPAVAPAAMRASAAAGLKSPASAAPTCSVVATMFAPAKMMNRSTPDWVRAEHGTGEMSAAFIQEEYLGRRPACAREGSHP